jgi:polysaccharide export outer membrane protein
MLRYTAFFLSIALVAGCARNRYPTAPTVPTDDPSFAAPERIRPRGLDSDPAQALMLLPGDVVQLTTVSAKEQIYLGLIVDALGQLHVPLAGDVQVGGMPLSKAERAVERGLRQYDRFARANLIITQLNGHSASVLGQAANPGRYTVHPGMRLGDLVALAGGAKLARSQEIPTLIGNLDLARLVRNGETVPVSVPLAMKGDLKHNVRVHPGDQLYIPPITAEIIIVLGDVGTPQPMAYREGIRLTEVLARAGGNDTIRADRKDVRIIRGPLREPRIYTANLKALTSGKATDVEMLPGDIVYLTKNWYTSAADVLNAMAPIIALSQSIATFALAYSIGR